MKKIYIIIPLIIIIIIALFFLLKDLDFFKDTHSLYYEGDVRHFRANIFEANKTPVFPNEDAIKDVLLNPNVFKVYIAYFPNDTENAFYGAASFEIGNKLEIIYRHYLPGEVAKFNDVDGSSCLAFLDYDKSLCLKSLPINSTDDLVPTSVEPVILLLGPSHANQTSVIVNNNLIIVQGKDFSEINRKYTDLDLAVDKMLLVLMED